MACLQFDGCQRRDPIRSIPNKTRPNGDSPAAFMLFLCIFRFRHGIATPVIRRCAEVPQFAGPSSGSVAIDCWSPPGCPDGIAQVDTFMSLDMGASSSPASMAARTRAPRSPHQGHFTARPRGAVTRVDASKAQFWRNPRFFRLLLGRGPRPACGPAWGHGPVIPVVLNRRAKAGENCVFGGSTPRDWSSPPSSGPGRGARLTTPGESPQL
jgi:hypothetical protein